MHYYFMSILHCQHVDQWQFKCDALCDLKSQRVIVRVTIALKVKIGMLKYNM